ncbi:MAG TPA: bifunctional tetrahydrofolate synthase/dihydrofolate synthase [Povalibacter sp.]|uniref:bifunctional tetrahydrofolate synthase/dihydrofolate synthase n=1 Tax=Povalibacter sp. TaxID=1962978 RepID=UPI002C735FD8|nr:bifunctional tetrahydrofolate synthase/dihydrofolate synthase [Povalibacter sp.]HMN45669.1 bifunctional tetrahydrofolate synthase/dihydrofolate synthase [Povalibacter sp.]
MRFTTLTDWLAWQQTLHPNAIDLGLERLNRTLQRLGWRRPACPVITVAGTNGKGSSVALLNRILGEAGYRVGTFTSPHLLRYNERIMIADREVSDASLIAAFERIDAVRGADTLTYFEFNALAALLVFETAGLDALVLEVGLGGRLDAANAVDADVALITSIDLDHCEWLGPDVESIGREKAGIFRAGQTAIFGSGAMPASIQSVADALGTKLLCHGRDYQVRRSGTRWSWQGVHGRLDDLPAPALVGDIQFDNAAAVLTVLEALAERLPVSRDAIERGLRKVQITGRFQRIRRDHEWILDVAHNPAAARVLASQLATPATKGRTIAVCGILGDKDIEGICRTLTSSIDVWIAAGLGSERSIRAADLGERLRQCGANVFATTDNVSQACATAASLAAAADRIVVFGSFLTVAAALQWLEGEGG